jgi:hypothetical protein
MQRSATSFISVPVQTGFTKFGTCLFEYCAISFNSDVTRHNLLQIVRNVTVVPCHIALVRKRWRAPMLNMEIKGPFWRRAGGGMNPVITLLEGVRNQNFGQRVTCHTLVQIE